MVTKVKMKVKRPETDLIPASTLKEGDWFTTRPTDPMKRSTIGVIVDGKPFYPWWLSGFYRSTELIAYSEMKVKRINILLLKESCRTI